MSQKNKCSVSIRIIERALVAVFCATAAFAVRPNQARAADAPAHAKRPDTAQRGVPQLASFEALMRATPAARKHYVRQLQLLLVDLASLPDNGGLFAEAEPIQNRRSQLLSLLVAVAEADNTPTDLTPYPKDSVKNGQPTSCLTDSSLGVPVQVGDSYICPNFMIRHSQDLSAADNVFVQDNSPVAKRNAAFLWKDHSGKSNPAQPPDPTVAAQMADPRDQCKEPDYAAKDGEDSYCSASATAKFERKPGAECIFAGVISSYGKNKFCTPQTKACADGSDPSAGCKDSRVLSCDQSTGSSAICNPIIFGAKDTNSPYCVPTGGGRGKNATRNCAALAASVKPDSPSAAAKPTDSAATPDFLAEGNSKAKAEAWTKFKDSFSNLCKVGVTSLEGGEDTVKPSPNCTACQVIKRRITAMNTRLQHAINVKGTGDPHTITNCDWNFRTLDAASVEQDLDKATQVYGKQVH